MNQFKSFETPDGRQITVRPINKNDGDLLIELFRNLSSETKRFRYNANMDHISDEIVHQESRRLSNLDPDEQFALIAFSAGPEAEEPIGVARFARLSENGAEAEVAIVIRDDFQGQGLGRHLLAMLTMVACQHNINRFVFMTTSDNTPMIKLVKDVWSEVEIDAQQNDREIWATIC